MKNRNIISIRQAILLATLCGASAWGANVPVDIVDFAFDPPSITINVNDTVVWTWQGDNHSTTSEAAPPVWDSGVFDTGYIYSFTFTSTGDYPYYCVVHGFTGDVNVVANNPPTVTLTNPPTGATLSAPATIQLAATAADSDGTVVSVGFFEGPTLLATATNSPYSFVVTNLGAGPYTFSAVATDNGGLTATNSISLQVVSPLAITLTSAKWTSPASFQFDYGANPGLRYAVLRSLALSNWVSISTNTATNASMPFQDTNASPQAGFYRVERLPNP